MHAGLHTREFNAKYSWGSFKDDYEGDILALGSVPTDEEKRFVAPARKINRKASHQATNKRLSAAVAPLALVEEKIVQVLMTGVYLIKPIAPNVCEATMVNRLEDTGKIPKKIFNTTVGRSLLAVNDLKNYFERSGLIVDRRLGTCL